MRQDFATAQKSCVVRFLCMCVKHLLECSFEKLKAYVLQVFTCCMLNYQIIYSTLTRHWIRFCMTTSLFEQVFVQIKCQTRREKKQLSKKKIIMVVGNVGDVLNLLDYCVCVWERECTSVCMGIIISLIV